VPERELKVGVGLNHLENLARGVAGVNQLG
jgi:hypothetical protein